MNSVSEELRAMAADLVNQHGRAMEAWDRIRRQVETIKGSDLPRMSFESLLESFADLMNSGADEIVRITMQLPEGMQHCIIQFKECEKGHGRLTATNWIDHGCASCQIERLRAALEFYADPDTYSAITLFPDPPCGKFVDDFSRETSGNYNRPMPGKRARAALRVLEKDREQI